MKNKSLIFACFSLLAACTMSSCSNSNNGPVYKLIIAGMTDTAERRQSIDFSNPYYQSELVLVCKSSEGIDSNKVYSESEVAEILDGKILISQTGTVTDDMIEDVFVKKFNAIRANSVDSFTTASISVLNGQAFAFTAELPVAKAYVGGSEGQLTIMHIDENILGEENLASLGVSIGIKKGQSEFVSKLNEALDAISNDARNSIMEEMVSFNMNNNEAKDNVRSKLTGENGTIIIGLECNYPSFNWTEFEQNNYTYNITGKSTEFAEGYDVEIAYRIASYLGMTLEIEKMEWDALLPWANI